MNTRPLIIASVALAIGVGLVFAQTATDAQKKAVEKYPDLGKPGSALHSKFMDLHREAMKSEPAVLANADWPLILAGRAFDILNPPQPMVEAKPLKVDVLAKAKAGTAFRIAGGEVTVDGTLIKRVELGRDTAVITYLNKTKEALKPNYSFRLFNAYGMQVGVFRDQWTFSTLDPGEVHKENQTFYLENFPELLRFSTIKIPDGWAEPVFLVIDGRMP